MTCGPERNLVHVLGYVNRIYIGTDMSVYLSFIQAKWFPTARVANTKAIFPSYQFLHPDFSYKTFHKYVNWKFSAQNDIVPLQTKSGRDFSLSKM